MSGSFALTVAAAATETTLALVDMSQPRTSTSATWSALVTVARRVTRLTPRSSTSAFSRDPGLPLGASLAAVGRPKSSFPSTTATRKPVSNASRRRNSQSVTPSCVTCLSTGPPASIVPGRRPAREATFRAMSEAVDWT